MWSDGLWVGNVERRYQPPDPTPAAATAATAPIPAPSPTPAPASTLDAGDRQALTTSTCVRPRGSGPHSSSSRGRVASSSRTMCAAPPPSPRRSPRSSPPCSAPPRCASTAGPSTPPSKEPHSQPSPRSSTRGAPARAPCADVAWPGLASTQARPADAAAAVAPPVSPPPRAHVAAAAHCPCRHIPHLRHAGTLDFEYSLARPQMGYCAPTLEPGDCARGIKGGWNSTALGIADFAGCAARCRGCARCHYVSFSPLHEDCSWFHTCEMSDLRMRWAGYTYETAAVSSSAPRALE